MSINNLEVFGNIPITRNGRMFTQQDADLLESKTGRNKIRQSFPKLHLSSTCISPLNARNTNFLVKRRGDSALRLKMMQSTAFIEPTSPAYRIIFP
jgi:hypothetical protein